MGWTKPLAAIGVAVTLSASAYAAETLSAADASRKASAGTITLIDIRRPQEWQQSGVAASARTLSMHEAGFLEGLAKLTGGDTSKPVALICRTGARSTFLAKELEKRGYTNVLNVREGMFGSDADPGWLKNELPIRKVR